VVSGGATSVAAVWATSPEAAKITDPGTKASANANEIDIRQFLNLRLVITPDPFQAAKVPYQREANWQGQAKKVSQPRLQAFNLSGRL
jgi:hypothetical protein